MAIEIKSIPVRTFMKKLYCTECNVEMKINRKESKVGIKSYVYNCPNCKSKTTENEYYPMVEYIPHKV